MELGPIFLGGLANSGKTELRMILERHPRLSLTRRTYMWTRDYNRFGDLGRPENLERCLSAMLARGPIRELEPDLARIRREFAQGAPTYARLFGLFHAHYAERHGKVRWGDQLGRVERYAEPIFAGFRAARMIHMVRNPRHVHEEAMARARQRKGKVGWATAAWLESVNIGIRNLNRFPDGYLMVRYESLMSHPAETVAAICDFIGEDFLPSLLDAGAGTPPLAAKSNRQTGSRSMSVRDVAFMQSYAGQTLPALGYALEPTRLSWRDRLLFLLIDWPANRAGMAAWRSANPGRLA